MAADSVADYDFLEDFRWWFLLPQWLHNFWASSVGAAVRWRFRGGAAARQRFRGGAAARRRLLGCLVARWRFQVVCGALAVGVFLFPCFSLFQCLALGDGGALTGSRGALEVTLVAEGHASEVL